MTKHRSLVLALSLAAALGGTSAGLPAAVAAPMPISATAPAESLAVAEAPVPNTLDVVGGQASPLVPTVVTYVIYAVLIMAVAHILLMGI